MPELVLAHDIGTSALKSAVVDRSGCILASVSRKYDTSFGQDGEATQNPENWVHAAYSNTRDIAAALPGLGKDLCGIG
ncbi:MAG TPA: hypothetical protein DD727_05220, partial [Clostridiales bacterium]|nr:hypothetical protein [Clostridiales bacterium]